MEYLGCVVFCVFVVYLSVEGVRKSKKSFVGGGGKGERKLKDTPKY